MLALVLNKFSSFLLLKNFLENICISSFCGATDTPVLDFWWHLPWVSKPEWTALFELCGGVCVTRSLRFFVIFEGYKSFLWGYWYPWFGLLVISPLVFKPQWILQSIPYRQWYAQPQDSPLVWHLLTSWWSIWQPSLILIHVLANKHCWAFSPGLSVWLSFYRPQTKFGAR